MIHYLTDSGIACSIHKVDYDLMFYVENSKARFSPFDLFSKQRDAVNHPLVLLSRQHSVLQYDSYFCSITSQETWLCPQLISGVAVLGWWEMWSEKSWYTVFIVQEYKNSSKEYNSDRYRVRWVIWSRFLHNHGPEDNEALDEDGVDLILNRQVREFVAVFHNLHITRWINVKDNRKHNQRKCSEDCEATEVRIW